MRHSRFALAVILAVSPAAAFATEERAEPGRFDPGLLDRTVDPCVDFYEFACGGWRKANPVPPDQTRWGRFNELSERNREVLRQLLEEARDPKRPRSSVQAKVGDCYAACMDEAGIEARGTQPLQPILASVDQVRTKAELFRRFGENQAAALPGLFGFGAAPDLHDSRRTIANLGQGGISLPDRDDYLKDDAKSKEKREKFVAHVVALLQLAGVGRQQASADAQTVLRIESALAEAYLDRVAMRDPRNRDNPMRREELKQLAPAVDFESFFGGVAAPPFERLNVSSRRYFEIADALVAATPLQDWKTYLRWRSVRLAAPYLGSAFVAEDYRFNREYLNGAKEMEPRWKRCVQATDSGLGDALGQLYVEKTFGADGKARMRTMIDALTAALREDIEGLAWMTAQTKQKALEKLAAFNTGKVGYPAEWKDYSAVEIRRDDYFGNARRAQVFEVRRNLARIGKPTDRTLWGMTAPTVNAYYNAGNNEIVFPAGILQPPFFDRGIDDPVNFGGIGVVIGHEYTHGFDDQGSKFDPDGNLNNWWSADDLKQFQQRTDCIASQYGEYVTLADPVNGDVKLNGRLTLGENTADNGGARVAFRALQRTLAGRERSRIDGFTPEQRFFLGFANVWCENVTDAAARQRAQTDPHASGRYRVIGTVSNMEEFRQAFGCQAGQPMVREKACRAW